MRLTFETLRFKESPKTVDIFLLKYFKGSLKKEQLEKIGPFTVHTDGIEFDANEHRVNSRFSALLEDALSHLNNTINSRPTAYIHQGSGVPLIGNITFGIIDRNNTMVEVKPVTGCNLDCNFCSIAEGRFKATDYVIEEKYLVSELRKHLDQKAVEGIEIYINPHGDPTLYADLPLLIADIRRIKWVDVISINTNGILLTPRLIDDLAEAGITRINVSIHAMDDRIAEELAGRKYPVQHVMKMLEKAKGRFDIQLCPVLVPGYNENEMEKLIEFALRLDIPIRIQNFLPYKGGLNPVKEWPWEKFYTLLKQLEQKYNTQLITTKEDFNIKETPPLKKPFKRRDIIKVELKFPGRAKGEMVAVSPERSVLVRKCHGKPGDIIAVRIIRSKHNIFIAEPA